MIDNIRLNFNFNPEKNWLEGLKEKITLKESWRNKKYIAYTGKLFFDSENNIPSSDKRIPLLYLEILHSSDSTKITIQNSLRKWYFNSNVIGDFTKLEFLDCLSLISDKLQIPIEYIHNAKVTKLEYGANLHFKPKYRCFYSCIHVHSELKKKVLYENETVLFKGENRSVIFYDKISEQKKDTFKVKNQKKLNAVKLLLRYEIKINKMSGCPEKPLMSFVKDIILNWEKMVSLWIKELDYITFVNDMSPEIYNYLDDVKIKPIKDYLIYLGIKSIGLKNFGFILDDRIYIKCRKSLSNELLKKYSEFDLLMKQENFEKTFRKVVYLKAKKLLL